MATDLTAVGRDEPIRRTALGVAAPLGDRGKSITGHILFI